MEEPPLLIAMQPIIGGIHIDDDLGRLVACIVVFQEVLHEEPFDLLSVIEDLPVSTLSLTSSLEPMQCALTGQRLPDISDLSPS